MAVLRRANSMKRLSSTQSSDSLNSSHGNKNCNSLIISMPERKIDKLYEYR